MGFWRMGFELDGLEDDDEYRDNKSNNDVFGDCVLFFGCRNRSKDYIFEKELQGFLDDGTLTRLFTAFSRDQRNKIYVQDRMREQGLMIYDMLVRRHGYIYVCGDGAKMAHDVDEALHDVLGKHGGMDKGAVAETIAELQAQRRYVKDVWS